MRASAGSPRVFGCASPCCRFEAAVPRFPPTFKAILFRVSLLLYPLDCDGASWCAHHFGRLFCTQPHKRAAFNSYLPQYPMTLLSLLPCLGHLLQLLAPFRTSQSGAAIRAHRVSFRPLPRSLARRFGLADGRFLRQVARGITSGVYDPKRMPSYCDRILHTCASCITCRALPPVP